MRKKRTRPNQDRRVFFVSLLITGWAVSAFLVLLNVLVYGSGQEERLSTELKDISQRVEDINSKLDVLTPKRIPEQKKFGGK